MHLQGPRSPLQVRMLFHTAYKLNDEAKRTHLFTHTCFESKLWIGHACVLVQGPRSPLQVRVLFHTAYKLNDEDKLLHYHQQLSDTLEDQLSLASIHYQRG